MKRMSKPAACFKDILFLCEAGITGKCMVPLKKKLETATPNLIPLELKYETAAHLGTLCKLQALGKDEEDLNSFELNIGLSKSDLAKIYTQYFREKEKPARQIYDSIKNAAKDICPYCGLTTEVKNLDHFLPQTHFPQFSVLPQNLIPSCGICNSDQKGTKYASTQADQIIHPYFDPEHFFNEQWIFAEFHANRYGKTGVFEYSAIPPSNWDITDKKRATKHFSQFDLGKRYSKIAGAELSGIIETIDKMRNYPIPVIDIPDILFNPKIEYSPFINHWQTGMYQALKAWLLNEDTSHSKNL